MSLVATLAFAGAAASQDAIVTRFRAPEGPQVDDVRAIHWAADSGLWVGTNGAGVSRFDGTDWTHVSEEDLGMSGVASIFPGARGDLAIGGRAMTAAGR